MTFNCLIQTFLCWFGLMCNTTPPTPPPTPYTVTGVVTHAGIPLAGVSVEFAGLGRAVTDAFGTYQMAVPRGYSGSATARFGVAGSFTPAVRKYTNVKANRTRQNYTFSAVAGTENVLLTRPGAFALAFVAASTTGYYAVQSESGAVTVHASGAGTVLDYTNSFCRLWPCLSVTDSYNTGNLTDLQADGVQGLQGELDLTGLGRLEQVVVAQQEINSLTLTGCTNLVQISAFNCLLGSSEVNAVLVQTDANGAHNGVLSITGNAPPTGAGLAAKASLLAKGWIVDTD